jgi:ribose transport system substrate-binding protein
MTTCAVLLLAAGALVLTAGCNNREKGGAGAADNNAAPASGNRPGVTGKTVAIISPAKTSEFHQQLPMGAAEEAKKLGWPDIIDESPSREDDYTGQVALAQDIIQRHPDAISVCGINPDALNNIIAKANAANIPIFVHNQITSVKAGTVVAYIGYDEREGGKLCGEEALKLLTKKNGSPSGTVAILDGEPGTHTDDRAGGFREALKDYPDVHIVDEKNGKWDRAEGAGTTKDWLQRFPKLDLVFGCSDAMVQGAAEAATQAGHPIFTIGIDGNKSSLEDIKAGGKLTATLAVQPRKMGATIVDTMRDYFDKKTAPTVVKTDMVMVTGDNVDQYIQK